MACEPIDDVRAIDSWTLPVRKETPEQEDEMLRRPRESEHD